MTKHEVVIAGGGPTGLMLAAELALAKVDVAVVERRPNQAVIGSRALGFHARTIEVLDQRGVAERFLSRGQVAQTTGFSFVRLDIGDFPTRHPYGLGLPQARIEEIMADWVGELPVTFHRGRDVTGFAEDGTGVSVEVEGGTSLRADYLVGCDGGRSSIRKKAGIAFPGWDPSVTFLIAEAEMAEEPPWGIRRAEKGVTAIGKSPDGAGARMVLVEPTIGGGDEPSFEELRAALISIYGKDFGIEPPTWISRFSDSARQAATYRRGRVLLAGDAAHVHAPVGGQGLGIGVQDAVNLGWKLAQVVRGISPESLLDTYHAERHPIAARVLRLTLAQVALSRGDDRTEALRDVVTDLMSIPEARKRYGAIMSGLEVHYDLGGGHPLLGRRMPDLEIAIDGHPHRVFTLLHEAKPIFLDFEAAIDITPWAHRVRRVCAHYAGPWELPLLGAVEAPKAVLVRPDGHVAWVGMGTDDGLVDALEKWFGRPQQA